MRKWETAPDRAWKDTTDWLLNHIFAWVLAFLLPGGGTMLATWSIPANVSIRTAAIYGFVGGLLGLAFLLIVVYVTQFILAPKKQRDEARKETEKLQDTLGQINNARPNMVLVRTENFPSPITNVRTGAVIGTPWFARVQFANDPLSSLQAVDANNVAGHIEIYSQDRQHSYFKMIGRWSETKEVAVGGQPIETDQIVIPANGRPYPMDIGLKYREDGEFYGCNNDNPRLAADWRDRQKRLPVGDYSIRVRLRGNNVDKEFWFELANKGKGENVELKAVINSPSAPHKEGSQA